MASTSKRIQVEEARLEEESMTIYDGDSESEGMTRVRRVKWIPFPQIKAIFEGKQEQNFHIPGHAVHTQENMCSGIAEKYDFGLLITLEFSCIIFVKIYLLVHMCNRRAL